MNYCPFNMITVDHFMDSILVVAQQQASGEESTYWYMLYIIKQTTAVYAVRTIDLIYGLHNTCI